MEQAHGNFTSWDAWMNDLLVFQTECLDLLVCLLGRDRVPFLVRRNVAGPAGHSAGLPFSVFLAIPHVPVLIEAASRERTLLEPVEWSEHATRRSHLCGRQPVSVLLPRRKQQPATHCRSTSVRRNSGHGGSFSHFREHDVGYRVRDQVFGRLAAEHRVVQIGRQLRRGQSRRVARPGVIL